jgi:hypothetical protein
MPTLISCTPPRNSTEARIHSSRLVSRTPARVRPKMANAPMPLSSAMRTPKYVASLSGTSENETMASNARRKSAAYEAPRPLVRPARR